MSSSPGSAISNSGTLLRNGFRIIRKRPIGALSLLFLVVAIVASIAAPLFAPYGPYNQNLLAANAGPSAAHLLGTDELGRDLFPRRRSLAVAAVGLDASIGLLSRHRGLVTAQFIPVICSTCSPPCARRQSPSRR